MKESLETKEEKHSRVTISIPPDILEELDRLAIRQDRSRSKMVTRAMRFFIQTDKEQKESLSDNGPEERRSGEK